MKRAHVPATGEGTQDRSRMELTAKALAPRQTYAWPVIVSVLAYSSPAPARSYPEGGALDEITERTSRQMDGPLRLVW